MGSVSPLLAIVDEMRHQRPGKDQFLWVGTMTGPEKVVIENYGIPFMAIAAGKFRRYLSVENFFDIFRVFKGYRQVKKILRKFQPNVVLTAGSYVSVPVAKAAARLKIPYTVHQQDVLPGLANKLMAKNAMLITVTFPEHVRQFDSKKTVFTGNPVRPEILRGDRARAREVFGLREEIPTLLVMGGGTGAIFLNEMVIGGLGELSKHYQIIHITGDNKAIAEAKLPVLPPFQRQRYKQYSFLIEDMKDAYALADLVICRSSASTASELALLGKAVLFVPIPDSHQVQNAVFFKKNNAAFLLDQKTYKTPEAFVAMIQFLLAHHGDLETVRMNIKHLLKPDAAKRILVEIVKIEKK